MRVFIGILLIGFAFKAQSQVKLLRLDELDQRVANGKDTTYVVNFWATWCTPCVAELPGFEQINAEQSKKPVKVLLVSVDFKSKLQKAVVPFVQAHGFKSEIFLLNEPDQQQYISRINPHWSGAIPATLFILNKKRYFFEQSFTYSALKAQLLKLNR